MTEHTVGTVSSASPRGILGGMPPHLPLTWKQILYASLMSLTILFSYLVMNYLLYPGYPVINDYAERSQAFSDNYPPFRMNEWLYYSITDELATGSAKEADSLARKYPIGYSLVALPLTHWFGDIGLYYTNAFIVWCCTIVFFWLVRVTVGYGAALFWTVVLAYASPNLFFAASAYGEPLGQMLLLVSTSCFLYSIANERRRRFYLVLSGLTAGLQLLTIPYLTVTVFISGAAIVVKRWQLPALKKDLYSLFGGFLGALVLFVIINLVWVGTVPFSGFYRYGYLDIFNRDSMYYSGSNAIISLLKLFFDSPHGVVFVMPITMLTPLGICAMWRRGSRTLASGTIIIILFILAITAVCECPISGEVVGTRQIGALIPFLLLPLAFLVDYGFGEKLWLAFTMLLTVYQCSFGWWHGQARGEGAFVGILNDRDARYIILARKDMTRKPSFRSSAHLLDHYHKALLSNDIKQWFETLDFGTIDEITGFERVIFARLVQEARSGEQDVEAHILSVDPDSGIKLDVTDIFFMQSVEEAVLPENP